MSVRLKICKQIESMKDDLIDFTRRLVRICSVNPPGNETIVAEEIARELSRWDFDTEIIGPIEERANLIAYHGGSGKTLLFNGHTDTVTLGENWNFEPLGAEIVGDRIYGRGACDMKGSIAAFCYAAIALKALGIYLKGKLVLSATSGEETGESSKIGLGYIVNKGLKADAAIVCEPFTDKIAIGHKGVLRLEIISQGKEAHSSQPEKGKNAIDSMIDLLVQIRRLRFTWDKTWFKTGPTISVTTMVGGRQVNVIPAFCRSELDIRLPPDVTKEIVLGKINTIIDKLKRDDPKNSFLVKETTYINASLISPAHEIVKILQTNAKEIIGEEPFLDVVSPTCDAYLLNRIGVPTICGFGPDGGNYHSTDEWVSIKSLVDVTKIYALTSIDFLGI